MRERTIGYRYDTVSEIFLSGLDYDQRHNKYDTNWGLELDNTHSKSAVLQRIQTLTRRDIFNVQRRL